MWSQVQILSTRLSSGFARPAGARNRAGCHATRGPLRGDAGVGLRRLYPELAIAGLSQYVEGSHVEP